MDIKRMLLFALFSLAFLVGWAYVSIRVHQNKAWFPDPVPEQPATQPTTQPSTAPGVFVPTTRVATSGPAATSPSAATTTPAGLRVVGGEARNASLGVATLDPDGKLEYPVHLEIGATGAGIESVTLNRFKENVDGKQPYTFQLPYEGVELQYSRALATRGVSVNGTWVDLAGATWEQVEADKTHAIYQVKIMLGDNPLIVRKTFSIKKKETPSEGYEVGVAHEFVNQTHEPLRVKLSMNGPNMPAPENTRDIPSVLPGYRADARRIELESLPASTYTPEKGEQAVAKADLPMVWVGVSNAYFDAIVRPTLDAPRPIESVKARGVKPATESGMVETNLLIESPEIAVAAGSQAAYPTEVYFGPKWRDVLKTPHYATFPLQYDLTLVIKSGMCAFCTFDWLVNVLVWMLGFFHLFMRDWGLAIILLVLVVRLCLHPITKRSQVSMSKMSKMGPEIERLKKKYKDQPDELNKAMMQFYKEQGATPILGCLPMFLQMPIWIALWSCLQSTFELRQAPFLWGYTWIKDLAQPDHLIKFSQPLSLWKFHIDGINLLPILMAVVFFFQQKFQPKPVAVTPEQQQQQKMMQWMSLLFPVFLYPGPSGLNLYILTSTAIGIWEAKRIRDHIKEREEREKQLVIVDAPEEQEPRKGGKPAGGKQPPQKKAGGLAGWLAQLQEKAEDLRNEGKKRK